MQSCENEVYAKRYAIRRTRAKIQKSFSRGREESGDEGNLPVLTTNPWKKMGGGLGMEKTRFGMKKVEKDGGKY